MRKGSITIESAAVVGRVQLSSVTDEQFDNVVYLLGETFGSVMVRPDKANRRIQVWWYQDYSQRKMNKIIQQVLTTNHFHHDCEVRQERR